MRLGDELRLLEAAGRDDRAYTVAPNVCHGERVEGHVVGEGRAAVFVPASGMRRQERVKLDTARETRRAGPAVATVIEHIGRQPRAFDLERVTTPNSHA